MRAVLIVVGTLLTLGLAAFGVVAAQNASGPISLAALAARFIPPSSQSGGHAQPAAAAPAQANQMAQASQRNEASLAANRMTRPQNAGAPVTPVAEKTLDQPPPPQSSPVVAAPVRVAENTSTAPAPAPAVSGSGNANANATAPIKTIPACDKPDALGLSRIVEIDTTGGPAFGFEHFKQYDFLRDKEVVLTFDDGPWPENTPMVLKALTDNCAKGTFFEIGEHAVWHPEIAKQVAEAGMTIGSHTWSHKDLARNPYASDLDQAKQEIEMGVSAVHMAVGGPIAAFFRFPDLQHPAPMMSYLAERNIATFSTDIDSFDFKIHKPEQVIQSVMTKLEKRGKGIILMHDFQHATAEAMPELLRQLKAGGYKVVHMVSKEPVTPLEKYDDMVKAKDKLSVTNTRPENSVVRTIGE
jgi:peptidoglycan/xylan/chitin deacetylase (PgdA/CDA1 family)